MFHGAANDVLWLQKDFGIYVVNLFDTFQAAKLLSLRGCSLAFLLKEFFQITINKQYQLADRRIRPLPQEMINYAAKDTHYLLEIYDIMKHKLIALSISKSPKEPNKYIHRAFINSKKSCEVLYSKPELKDDEYFNIIENNRLLLTKGQMAILKAILKWRDYIGRIEDESLDFVCPNDVIFIITRLIPVNFIISI